MKKGTGLLVLLLSLCMTAALLPAGALATELPHDLTAEDGVIFDFFDTGDPTHSKLSILLVSPDMTLPSHCFDTVRNNSYTATSFVGIERDAGREKLMVNKEANNKTQSTATHRYSVRLKCV